MGFLSKLAAKMTPAPLDYASEIGDRFSPGDGYLAHSLVIPSAYERGGGSGPNRLLSGAVDAVTTAVSSGRHVGGDEGSTASTLTQKADLTVMVLGKTTVTWWDLGYDGRTGPAELVQSVPRDRLTSIEDTGKKAQGGVPVVRFHFDDGSYFDYRLMDKGDEQFWSVAATYCTTD